MFRPSSFRLLSHSCRCADPPLTTAGPRFVTRGAPACPSTVTRPPLKSYAHSRQFPVPVPNSCFAGFRWTSGSLPYRPRKILLCLHFLDLQIGHAPRPLRAGWFFPLESRCPSHRCGLVRPFSAASPFPHRLLFLTRSRRVFAGSVAGPFCSLFARFFSCLARAVIVFSFYGHLFLGSGCAPLWFRRTLPALLGHFPEASAAGRGRSLFLNLYRCLFLLVVRSRI